MSIQNTRLFALLLFLAQPLGATTYTVTSTADSPQFTPDIPGTLRWAINQANANAGPDVIVFSIPGVGVQTIVPLWQLPALTGSGGVTIDALTQPGASAGNNPPCTATLLIEIRGTNAPSADGLQILSDDNVVRGLVINQFQRDGILIQGGFPPTFSADRNVIYCNFVGTDPAGVVDLGNGTDTSALRGGIHVSNVPFGQANNNEIDANLVSGNWADGIWLEGPKQPGAVGFNQVTNNLVGTDVTGTVDLGNDHEGVALTEGTHDNTVHCNLVSGNDTDGIGLQGFNNVGFLAPPIQTTRNTISQNIVGLDINLNPANPLGNTLHGIAVGLYGAGQWGCADSNTFRENVIAYNGGDGVAVHEDFVNTFNADNNRITQNAIWANGGIGIDLADDGVTPNGPPVSFGPNQDLNYPVITGVVHAAGVTTVSGTLAVLTPSSATVEVFKARTDPSGHGEGESYVGSAVPNGAGSWSLVTTRLIPGDPVTATATDSAGNTSEFAFNAAVPGVATLSSDMRILSVRKGGAVNFSLAAGAPQAGRQYLMLASLSGVAPGTPLGAVTVPVNFDLFTTVVLQLTNTPAFANFSAVLDGAGNGAAQLNLPRLSASLNGAVLHFSYVLLSPTVFVDFASNPISVVLSGC